MRFRVMPTPHIFLRVAADRRDGTRKRVADVGAKNRSPVKWLAVAPDSDGSVLIAYADGLISLWNLKQQKVARHYELHSQPLEACAWHPEGKFFITGYEVALSSPHKWPLYERTTMTFSS